MAVALRADHTAPGEDEQALVAAVRGGDDRAFERLYERYRARIGSFIQSMVADHGRAEDIAQEVFISALRHLRASDRPVMFKPWLYEIAKNACIDEYRRSRRAKEVPLQDDDTADDVISLRSPSPSPDMAIESKQQLDHLRGAFRGLSESHHRILVLRELEGLSYNQIGDRLGISKPVVESTLFRARRRLGEEYAEIESGRRCARVQGIIAAAGERPVESLGLRDRRLLSRHMPDCASCRRQAKAAGLEPLAGEPVPLTRRLAATAIAPAPLLRLRGGERSADLTAAGGHVAGATQALQAAGPLAGVAGPLASSTGTLSGLGRAATAAALAIAGAGGGIVAGRAVSSSGPPVPVGAAIALPAPGATAAFALAPRDGGSVFVASPFATSRTAAAGSAPATGAVAAAPGAAAQGATVLPATPTSGGAGQGAGSPAPGEAGSGSPGAGHGAGGGADQGPVQRGSSAAASGASPESAANGGTDVAGSGSSPVAGTGGGAAKPSGSSAPAGVPSPVSGTVAGAGAAATGTVAGAGTSAVGTASGAAETAGAAAAGAATAAASATGSTIATLGAINPPVLASAIGSTAAGVSAVSAGLAAAGKAAPNP